MKWIVRAAFGLEGLAAKELKKLGMQVFHGPHQAGTVSFLPGQDCEEAAEALAQGGIAVRHAA